MRSDRRIVAVILISLTLLLAACSPEASRERGGGPGADIGNRGATVELHGSEEARERIYYQTPARGRGIERSSRAAAISPES